MAASEKSYRAQGLYITEGLALDTLQEDQECHHFDDVPDDRLNLRAERGVKGERHVVTGEQVDEISLLAKEGKCDLIVVGHRRHESLLSPWWTGSLGASLIEERPRSVLIAKVPAEVEVAPALVRKP